MSIRYDILSCSLVIFVGLILCSIKYDDNIPDIVYELYFPIEYDTTSKKCGCKDVSILILPEFKSEITILLL